MSKEVTEMTTRELRAYIRQLTPQVNENYKSYQDALTKGAMQPKPILEERHARLVSLGQGQKTKRAADPSKTVGMGLSLKKKSVLIVQARALEQFIKIDTWSPAAIKKADAKARKAFKTFKRRQMTTLSFEQYKDLTEVMGAVGEHVLNEFGVYNIIKTYEQAVQQGKKKEYNIAREMENILTETHGQGKTKQEIVDILRERILKTPQE